MRLIGLLMIITGLIGFVASLIVDAIKRELSITYIYWAVLMSLGSAILQASILLNL